jgi:hypothetical protein
MDSVIKQLDKNSEKVCKDFSTIAKDLQDGGNYLDYEEAIDKLLGTGLTERDSEAEEIYERGHREHDE